MAYVQVKCITAEIENNHCFSLTIVHIHFEREPQPEPGIKAILA